MSDSIFPTNVDNCLVAFDKKEYAIVGDAYFAQTLEEVPDWFKKLVQDTVTQANGSTNNLLATYNLNLLAALQGIEISKNAYEQYITKLLTDEASYIAALTTMNSSIADSDASIRQLLTTYATRDFAVASIASTLSASLNGGAIGARIGSAERAMATQYGAMAQYVRTLASTFNDVASNQAANTGAIQALTTYTGYGTVGGLPALIANSSFYSNLDAYLSGTDYGIGGSSTLIQDVTTMSTAAAKAVEAKFEYGSTIELGGRTYNAGFGLVQKGTLLPDGTTYDSEFWIKASKFKFIADDGVTVSTPFQVDGGVVKIGWDAVTGSNRPADGATRNVNRGTWLNGIAYVVGDIVQHNGSSYTNKTATSNMDPTNSSYWTLMAAQGVAGVAGTQGPQGAVGGRGAATISYAADLGSTSISGAVSSAGTYFSYGGGPSPAVNGDSLMLTNSNTDYGWTNFYKYNGSSWSNSTKLQVDGDAVVKGTLSVNKLMSGSLNMAQGSFGLGTDNVVSFSGSSANAIISAISNANHRWPMVAVATTGDAGAIGGLTFSSSSLSNAGFFWNAKAPGYVRSAASLGGYDQAVTFWNGSTAAIKDTSYITGALGTDHGSSRYSGVYTVRPGVAITYVDYNDHEGYWSLLTGNTSARCRVPGGYLPFTGSHICTYSKFATIPEKGDVLVDLDVVLKYDVSNATTEVGLACQPQAKSVVGVFSDFSNAVPTGMSLTSDEYRGVDTPDPFYQTYLNEYFIVIMNSLGEGQVNVCGLGGDMEPGDLITSSSIPGKGMKQTDDVVRNYTVGKCREYVTFDYPEQVKQVACIYMCG